MKRKIILSVALVVSLSILLLTGSDSRVGAQKQERYTADTGIIKLGPGQLLRVTVASGDVNGDDIHVRFRQARYIEQDNLYRIESQTVSAPLTLAPNEAAFVDAADYVIWRVTVLSDSKDARVTVQIIDSATGQVSSVLIALLVP